MTLKAIPCEASVIPDDTDQVLAAISFDQPSPHPSGNILLKQSLTWDAETDISQTNGFFPQVTTAHPKALNIVLQGAARDVLPGIQEKSNQQVTNFTFEDQLDKDSP